MPRIPDDLLGRIKGEISLERLAEARGITLKRHGADLLGLCPFHDDHEPSLVITPEKNLWHCLGACQAGGTVVDWVMKAEGVSFRHAVEILRADFFPTLKLAGSGDQAAKGKNELPPLAAGPSVPFPPKSSMVRRLAAPVDFDADDRELLRQVVGYYHATLKESPEALGYLEKRGLVSSEMVDRFQLGYANRTLGLRLPATAWKAGGEIRGRLQKLGIIRDTGHEHFNGSLVIPILGEAGEVLGVYGRKITPNLRPGTPLHLYLPGPHRGVFNVEGLEAAKEVILCEALIDALTFWCAGFRNVTASYGVEGFTHDHLAAMKTYGTEHVLIAYDRDEAGDRAAEALGKKLIAEGIACSRVLFPKGMDANDVALKMHPVDKTLGLFLRSAQWMGNGRKGDPPENAAKEGNRTEWAEAPPEFLPLAAPEPFPATPAQPVSVPQAAKEGNRAEAPPALLPLAASDLDEFRLVQGDRTYRVRGLRKNLSYGTLRLNLHVSRDGEQFLPPSPLAGFYVDTLDLYSARARVLFEKEASKELGVEEHVVKRDLGQVLKRAEELQQEAIQRALEPKTKAVALSEKETAEAMGLLKDPKLLDRILEDFSRSGVVGEETNKLVGYLAATSRKLDRPLAVILQSSSAAGKSLLMEAILDFMPEEEREKYSALTGMSLFYFTEEKSLKHKILAVIEEEGAERATYALKLLQSEGELTIASTGKDPQTGRLVTQEYRVEGPVAIFLTTTAAQVDEELLNRCLVLSIDEEREQTKKIHELQRQAETIEGLLAAKEKNRVVRLHRNAQRLLRPLLVANPWAGRLTFLDDRTRTRRDHVKYLTLIRAIALLHQHQRPVKTIAQGETTLEYIEATLDDIAVANRLASEVLGRSLDELPPQTRRLLLLLEEWVRNETGRLKKGRADFLFSRKSVRAFAGWGDTQLRLHLARLIEMEYVLVHRGGRGQSFVYELLYDGQGKDGKPFLPGLIDVVSLEEKAAKEEKSGEPLSSLAALSSSPSTTETSRGVEGEIAGALRGFRGPVAAPSRVVEIAPVPAPDAVFLPLAAETSGNPLLGASLKAPSYSNEARAAKEENLIAPAGNGHEPRRYVLRRA
jgi:hypothetical protein